MIFEVVTFFHIAGRHRHSGFKKSPCQEGGREEVVSVLLISISKCLFVTASCLLMQSLMPRWVSLVAVILS